jgi:SAM-dependent methyltransferase
MDTPQLKISLVKFSGLDEFSHYQCTRGLELCAKHSVEEALALLIKNGGIEYFCDIHGGITLVRNSHSEEVNWREGMICETCRLNARMRLSLSLMKSYASHKSANRVYLTEQATYGYAAAKRMFKMVAGSEFVTDPQARNNLTRYIREITGDRSEHLNHEDATALSFADGSFDLVGSFEVLEHIPAYERALREFARVLVPGGVLVLTAPFLRGSASTIVRARVHEDGSIEHLLEPEYHGDPVKESGVLCFYHFGWDLLDTIRNAGFSEAEVVMPWSPAYGYLGDLSTIVAIR